MEKRLATSAPQHGPEQGLSAGNLSDSKCMDSPETSASESQSQQGPDYILKVRTHVVQPAQKAKMVQMMAHTQRAVREMLAPDMPSVLGSGLVAMPLQAGVVQHSWHRQHCAGPT